MTDVLVVDDEETMRMVVRIVLERAGLSVTTVADAETALVLILASPPRLVITDVYLPDMDGIDLLGAIRRAAPTLPVVMMSGGGLHNNLGPLEAGRLLGAVATLEKPFAPSALVTIVRAALDGH
jgi:DNA-binding NtrC family response regulator